MPAAATRSQEVPSALSQSPLEIAPRHSTMVYTKRCTASRRSAVRWRGLTPFSQAPEARPPSGPPRALPVLASSRCICETIQRRDEIHAGDRASVSRVPFEEPGSVEWWCFLLPAHIRVVALLTGVSGLLVFLSAVVASLRLLRRSPSAGGAANRYLHGIAIISAEMWLLAAAYERFVVTARFLPDRRAGGPGDYRYIEQILNRELAVQAAVAVAVILLSLVSIGLWRHINGSHAPRSRLERERPSRSASR